MTRAAACFYNPAYFRVAPAYMTAAILALGAADELSLVGLADISAPFSEAVSGVLNYCSH